MNKSIGKITAPLVFILIVLSWSFSVSAQEKGVELYLFYWSECPYCAKAREFLSVLKEKYPTLTVKEFEITDDKNQSLWQIMAKDYGRELTEDWHPVPMIFIDREMLPGFNEEAAPLLEMKVKDCLEKGCASPLDKIGEVADVSADSSKASKNSSDETSVFQKIWFWPLFLTASLVAMAFIVISAIKFSEKKRK